MWNGSYSRGLLVTSECNHKVPGRNPRRWIVARTVRLKNTSALSVHHGSCRGRGDLFLHGYPLSHFNIATLPMPDSSSWHHTQVELFPDVFYFWLLGFRSGMTTRSKFGWGIWAFIVHAAVFAMGLVIQVNISSDSILGLRNKLGGGTEWYVTLKMEDVSIATRMMGAQCVSDPQVLATTAGAAGPRCSAIWPSSPRVLLTILAPQSSI